MYQGANFSYLMQFLCHQHGRADSFRQLFLFPAVTSLTSGKQECWGVTLQRPGDTNFMHQCHWEPTAWGRHRGPVWAGGICPWGPAFQEADPPNGPCNDESLMAKSTKAFLGKSTASEKQENKILSVCPLPGKSWARGKVKDLMLQSWFLAAFQHLCVLINTYLCPLTFFLMSAGKTSLQGSYCVISLDERE